MAARLLFVSPADRDAGLDRLLIRDLAASRARFDAVLALEPLHGHAKVHLTLAPEYHLVCLGRMVEPHRGIFLHELGKGGAELDLVLAILQLDGNAIDGRRLFGAYKLIDPGLFR